MPAWRMPPPHILRKRRARSTISFEATKAEPTGAPRPLEKQTLTVSQWAAYCFSEMPVATAAFQRRAPSMWTAKPFDLAERESSARVSIGQTLPEPELLLFSTQTALT